MKPLLEAYEKRVRAVALFASGLSYAQIAREVGFSKRGSAHRAVTKGLAMHGNETIESIRAAELGRLEALHATQ